MIDLFILLVMVIALGYVLFFIFIPMLAVAVIFLGPIVAFAAIIALGFATGVVIQRLISR